MITGYQSVILTILLCKSAGFQKCDFSVIIQIFLVTNENDDNVWTGKSSSICQPVGEGVIGFTATTTKNKMRLYHTQLRCSFMPLIASQNTGLITFFFNCYTPGSHNYSSLSDYCMNGYSNVYIHVNTLIIIRTLVFHRVPSIDTNVCLYQQISRSHTVYFIELLGIRKAYQ